MESSLAGMRLDLGLAAVANVVREANRYLERRQPWTLAKQEDKQPLYTTLYCAVETLRIVSGLLYPVLPEKMTELRKALGITDEVVNLQSLKTWGGLKPGSQLGAVHSLFPRIMPAEQKPEAVPALGPVPTKVEVAPAGVALVEYTDFQKVQLRTAKILEAEKVSGADKLLRLQVESGGETRQIVAGIALHYEPAALIGKTIVIVANLKPAKIRGVESNGMLLAASAGKDLRVITVDGDLPTGSVVK